MRLKKQDGIDALKSVWLFERCSNRELAGLQRIATVLEVEAGRALTTEGDLGREFFVLLRGKVEATRAGLSIATLGAGSFFGEMALLDRQPRTATVKTLEPCTLLVITAGEFNAFLESMPSVDRKMLVVLAERLRDVEARFVPPDARVMQHPEVA